MSCDDVALSLTRKAYTMDSLTELQAIYRSFCDGEWEHEFGIRIETLDNPGWQVSIDLEGTPLERRHFDEVRFPPMVELPEPERWWHARILDGRWDAGCDPLSLGVVLDLFVTWARGTNASPSLARTPDLGSLTELQAIYRSFCDGEWEHEFGILIGTLDNPGWWVKIDLEATPLESRAFEEIVFPPPPEFTESPDRWWTARVRERRWEAYCDPLSLNVVLGLFVSWARDAEPSSVGGGG